MDAFNLPQGNAGDIGDLEKVNQEKDLEFKEDQMWYKMGELTLSLDWLSLIMKTVNFVRKQK